MINSYVGYKMELRHRQQLWGLQEGSGGGEVVKSKGGQIYGDGRCFDWVASTGCTIQVMGHRNVRLKARECVASSAS